MFELPIDLLKSLIKKDLENEELKDLLNEHHPTLAITSAWERRDGHINNFHLGFVIGNEGSQDRDLKKDYFIDMIHSDVNIA